MNAPEISIDKINIEGRARKSTGDVSDLCRSIEAVGLLHPVVITEKKKLVAGLRRIAAFKKLGRSKIPAVVVDTLNDAKLLLTAERDENSCRVPFTTLEAVAVGRALEELEKPQREKHQRVGKSLDGTSGGRGKKKPGENFPQGLGKAREAVGEAIGMSGPTYQRAKAVAVAAEDDPETFGPIAEEMERTGKVTPAFNKVQEIKSGKRPEPVAPTNGKKPVGVLRANEAIDCLMRIPKNDAHRKRGFQIVTDWIKHNKGV